VIELADNFTKEGTNNPKQEMETLGEW
jgi:hypothetical protein